MTMVSSLRSHVAAMTRTATLVACCALLNAPAARADHAAPVADQTSISANPNEVLSFGEMKIARWLAETVVRAAEKVDVDPVYMMALADKESSLSPESRAGTSSAEGLFQFITKTWFEVIRSYGPRYGLHTEAAAVRAVNGQLTVEDEDMRRHVLGLRRDPYIAAIMAAEMKKRDRTRIQRQLGRDLTRSEFYLAHFLGADSAGRFLKIHDEKPKYRATRAFPRAAKANKSLFFAKAGKKTRGLTVAEVYTKIDGMIDKRIERYARIGQVKVYADATQDF